MKRHKVGEVAGNHSSPEAHVDVALPLGGAALGLECLDRDRRRRGIQRHVDERRDAAGRGRPGRRLEAFPLRVSGLADVDVAVDQTGEKDLVRSQLHRLRRLRRGVECEDRDDTAVADADGPRRLSVGEDGAGRVDDQVEDVRRLAHLSWSGSPTGTASGAGRVAEPRLHAWAVSTRVTPIR